MEVEPFGRALGRCGRGVSPVNSVIGKYSSMLINELPPSSKLPAQPHDLHRRPHGKTSRISGFLKHTHTHKATRFSKNAEAPKQPTRGEMQSRHNVRLVAWWEICARWFAAGS